MESLAKKFDEEIEKYIEEYGIENEDFIKLEESFADLIIRNYRVPSKNEIKATNKKGRKFSLDKSLLIAMEFLATKYDGEYLNKLTEALNEVFIFGNDDDGSFYNPSTNQIILNLSGDIYDPIVIIHEFMHYVNNNLEVLSDASDYFTEAISYYNEFLVEDFIEEKYPNYKKDLQGKKHTREFTMYIKAIEFKVCAHLIKVKLNGHKINRWFLQEAIEEITGVPEYDFENAFIDMKYTLEGENFSDFGLLFEHLMEYVVADVFSRYLYYLSKNNKDIKFDINEALKNYDVEDLFKFLDVQAYREMDKETYDYLVASEEDFSIPINIKNDEIKRLEYIYKKQKRV